VFAPKLDLLAADVLAGLALGFFVVRAFQNCGGARNVSALVEEIDAISRHDGRSPKSGNATASRSHQRPDRVRAVINVNLSDITKF